MKARSKWLRNVGAGNSSDTSTVTEERSEDVGYGGLHARQMPAFLETRITPTLSRVWREFEPRAEQLASRPMSHHKAPFQSREREGSRYGQGPTGSRIFIAGIWGHVALGTGMAECLTLQPVQDCWPRWPAD